MTHHSPLDIHKLLRKYDLHPRKSLGQNFLIDEAYLQAIISASGVDSQNVVLEIGPGLGSLTRHLAAVVKQVTAVELDSNLIPPLKEVLARYKNVHLVQGDILDFSPVDLIKTPEYVVVANIPYYITSAVTRHLLDGSVRPKRIVMTVQEEVAMRICALPGHLSLLALSVQVYGNPTISTRIPASAFFPVPKVDSAVLIIDVFPQPAVPEAQIETFFLLIKAGFFQKRKTLRNSLSAGLNIPKDQVFALLSSAGIDPGSRAESLNLSEWHQLCLRYTQH